MPTKIHDVEQVKVQEAGQGFEVIDMEAWEAVYGGGSMSGTHTHSALTDLIVPTDLSWKPLPVPGIRLPE